MQAWSALSFPCHPPLPSRRMHCCHPREPLQTYKRKIHCASRLSAKNFMNSTIMIFSVPVSSLASPRNRPHAPLMFLHWPSQPA